MRLAAAVLLLGCLAACAERSQSEQTLVRYDDEWRQQQAILNAEAILQGMAQARRQRQEQSARTAR